MRISREIRLILWVAVTVFGSCQNRYSGAPKSDTPLVNTRWQLLRLGREEVFTPEGETEKYAQFALDSLSVRGFAGCNSFFGKYMVKNDTLRISYLSTTRKLCASQQVVEENFLRALQQTTRYRISGERLKLYRGDTLLATLQGQYWR